MIRVKATREGLLGKSTATGDVLDRRRPIVALPSVAALDKFVRLSNPRNGKTCIALVDDVGPWNEHDDRYVFQLATRPNSGRPDAAIRPQSELGIDTRGRTTNHAGIDLGEAPWRTLEMTDNDFIDWEFIE